jgi:flavin reductase (DIM6/NTAB) family NADH-FMN oxidoreductase RutF
MLRHSAPGWGPPPLPQVGQSRERTRWLWAVPLLASLLAAAGWILSHDPAPGLALSRRGWVTVVAAAVVAALLAWHRRSGELVHTIAEYAVVAALAILLATSTPDHAARAHAHDPNACPPVIQTRAWLQCIAHQASAATKPNHP